MALQPSSQMKSNIGYLELYVVGGEIVYLFADTDKS